MQEYNVKFLDTTKKLILPHLHDTELLLDDVIFYLTRKNGNSKLIPMEDLCFSDNIVRMKGGFFTGCVIKWQCDIPFIPVDATVNSCGVSIFKLNEIYDIKYFYESVLSIKHKYNDNWNFDSGNHFISFCKDKYGNQFLVIHASDSRFKFGQNGLYPYNSWYENKIKVFTKNNRYLRYIVDETAEIFLQNYKKSEVLNPIRNRDLCASIFGDKAFSEELYTKHYGMPSSNSIAIGTQWNSEKIVMLTAPGKDIFIFEGDKNEYYPHGFGMVLKDVENIKYIDSNLYINDELIEGDNNFISNSKIQNRFFDQKITKSFIMNYILDKKIESITELKQIAAFTRNGFDVY